jgi:hypothetical protein
LARKLVIGYEETFFLGSESKGVKLVARVKRKAEKKTHGIQ